MQLNVVWAIWKTYELDSLINVIYLIVSDTHMRNKQRRTGQCLFSCRIMGLFRGVTSPLRRVKAVAFEGRRCSQTRWLLASKGLIAPCDLKSVHVAKLRVFLIWEAVEGSNPAVRAILAHSFKQWRWPFTCHGFCLLCLNVSMQFIHTHKYECEKSWRRLFCIAP